MSAVPRILKEGKNRVAVVLSGCGVYDGSEVQETVFALSRLSRLQAKIHCFAPDKPQFHVINHFTGQSESNSESDESTSNNSKLIQYYQRNCLHESCRITRGGGNTSALSELIGKCSEFDAIIVPGGFGAAKNLCDFGPVGGPNFIVDAEMKKVITEFYKSGKPIGLSCIAPVIAAKVIGEGGLIGADDAKLKLTVGGSEEEDGKWPYAGTAGAIEALNCEHVKLPGLVGNVMSLDSNYNIDIGDSLGTVGLTVVDEKNKIITAPAYMCNTAPIHEIEDSMFALVDKTCEMID